MAISYLEADEDHKRAIPRESAKWLPEVEKLCDLAIKQAIVAGREDLFAAVRECPTGTDWVTVERIAKSIYEPLGWEVSLYGQGVGRTSLYLAKPREKCIDQLRKAFFEGKSGDKEG